MLSAIAEVTAVLMSNDVFLTQEFIVLGSFDVPKIIDNSCYNNINN